MFSGFIHVVASLSTSFLFIAESNYITQMQHVGVSHSSVDGYMGWFHFLAIMNNAAMNTCVQGFVWTYFFLSFFLFFWLSWVYATGRSLGINLQVELLDHMVTLFTF